MLHITGRNGNDTVCFFLRLVLYATPQEVEERGARKTSRRWYIEREKEARSRFHGIFLSSGYCDSLVGLQVRYPTKAAG